MHWCRVICCLLPDLNSLQLSLAVSKFLSYEIFVAAEMKSEFKRAGLVCYNCGHVNTCNIILNSFYRAALNADAVWQWESCLSLCPSLCQMRELWQNQIFIPYERSFSLDFSEKEWLVGATPFTWNFGSTGPCWILNQYSLVAPQPYYLAKKV